VKCCCSSSSHSNSRSIAQEEEKEEEHHDIDASSQVTDNNKNISGDIDLLNSPPPPSSCLDPTTKLLLETIATESLQFFSFDGIKRKLGMHQEKLSRALNRLCFLGFVEKTAEEGYQVTEAGKMMMGLPTPEKFGSSTLLIQTLLPQDIDIHNIISNLKGRWFANLRWLGLSNTEMEIILKWLVADDPNIQIDAIFYDGSLNIEAKLQQPDGNLGRAIKASHKVMEYIMRIYSRQSTAGSPAAI
jgi:hypothetical protein